MTLSEEDIRYAAVMMQDNQILKEVYRERRQQEARWGQQDHPDGTGEPTWTHDISPDMDMTWSAKTIANLAQARCERHAEQGRLTFLDIALEEIAEAFAETDPDLLRAELVQSAAVIVNWIGAIDRRSR